MSSKNHNEESLPEPSVPDREGFSRQLIDAYTAELERLRHADSEERAVIYDKAAELGVRIFGGEE